MAEAADDFEADADFLTEADFETEADLETDDDFASGEALEAADLATTARPGRAFRLPARFTLLAARVTFWLRAEPVLAARLSRLPAARAFVMAFLPFPDFAFASLPRFDFLFLAACFFALRSSALELGE